MKTLDEVIKALQKNADREMARWNEETCFISEENLLDALLYLKEYRAELAQNSGELGNELGKNLEKTWKERTAEVQTIDFGDIDLFKCRNCQYYVDRSYTYCPGCGVKLIWGKE